MVPAMFIPLFSASAGAGGALVGLLFVAVSIAPESTVSAGAPIERQAMAASTFTAMINAFFISLSALIPGQSLAYVALLVSASSLISSFSLSAHLVRRQHSGLIGFMRGILLLGVALVIYGYQLYYAIVFLLDPHNVTAIYVLCGLLLGAYGLGLARAWQLLGAQRFGLFGWFNFKQLPGIRQEPADSAGTPAGQAAPRAPAPSSSHQDMPH